MSAVSDAVMHLAAPVGYGTRCTTTAAAPGEIRTEPDSSALAIPATFTRARVTCSACLAVTP